MTQLTRRTFTATSVAAALATMLPSWRQFTQRKQIDLTPFCDDNYRLHYRYDLSKPFAQDGLVYATDNRICVRTALADVPALGESAKLPGASALPWWNCDRGAWKPWPKQSFFTDGDRGICPYCDGKGGHGTVADCPACDGVGFTFPFTCPEDDYTVIDCETCNSTGKLCSVPCDYCYKTGRTRRPHMLRLGNAVIGGQFDVKLRALGDLEFAELRGPLKVSPIAVRGDGFEALVMPITWRGNAQP